MSYVRTLFSIEFEIYTKTIFGEERHIIKRGQKFLYAEFYVINQRIEIGIGKQSSIHPNRDNRHVFKRCQKIN